MPQPKHIARILVPEIDHLDEETRKYFKICEDKLGMVPNVLRTYSGNIEKFRLFTAYYNNLMLNDKDCNLTILEREMIAVVVSSANRCYYCLVAHGQAVRQISGDPQLGEMLVMNYRVAELSPRTRAMLDFVWKLTKKPFDISKDDRELLREVNFSDKDIFDISDVASFFNYTNRMAHGLDMIPNAEYHKKNR